MYASAKPTSVIDAVTAREGKFTVSPETKVPEVEVVMVYSNQKTMVTFGTCPVKTTLFSEKTIDALKAFLKSAEEDFGALILEGGLIADTEEAPALGMAETNHGIKPRGLGGV